MSRCKRPTVCSRPSKKKCTQLSRSSNYTGELQLTDRIYRQLRGNSSRSPTTTEEAHAILDTQAREDNENMMRLIGGVVGPLYVQRARCNGAIVIEDDGTHKCNADCCMIPLNVRLFSVCNDQRPGAVHVCLGKAGCNAPANVHAFPVSAAFSSVFLFVKIAAACTYARRIFASVRKYPTSRAKRAP